LTIKLISPVKLSEASQEKLIDALINPLCIDLPQGLPLSLKYTDSRHSAYLLTGAVVL